MITWSKENFWQRRPGRKTVKFCKRLLSHWIRAGLHQDRFFDWLVITMPKMAKDTWKRCWLPHSDHINKWYPFPDQKKTGMRNNWPLVKPVFCIVHTGSCSIVDLKMVKRRRGFLPIFYTPGQPCRPGWGRRGSLWPGGGRGCPWVKIILMIMTIIITSNKVNNDNKNNYLW